MKKIFLILIITLFSSQLVAQQNAREKIKAMKTAFITNALDLSAKEAQQFWPIYNEYDKKIYSSKTLKTRELTRKIRLAGGVNELSDGEANTILSEFIKIDFEVAKAKQELQQKLKNIISGKKIIMLFKAEHDFNKKLLREFRNKRKSNLQKRTRN